MTDHNGKVLDKINLVNTVRPNEFAFKHLQAATDSRIFSTVFFTGASCFLGYTAGYFLVSQTVPRTMAIIGVSCLTGGILLKIRSNSQLKKCVNVYNSALNSSAYHNTPLELSWTINQNGLGFNLCAALHRHTVPEDNVNTGGPPGTARVFSRLTRPHS